ncbi:putative thioredoxin [Thamnocephalis sphaerospora]|uniref:Putative thioredoxin n=1 Tax=Thamnocephalis sphaerospora TaxID=78915 RepID=A0A4P9XJV4_9FUNG|nr:putative thioredoxin [Thamnocephalis sphaerospora]|eukprot:RKP06068.1 putative thioredoxin [Thamnocephalis sphaerospora]
MPVTEITSEEQLRDLLTSRSAGVSVLNFWASWVDQCAQMNQVFAELSDRYPLQFIQVEAEKFPDVSMGFEIEAAPTFVFVRNGKPVRRVDGAHAAELTAAVEQHSTAAPASASRSAASASSADTPRAPLAPPPQRSEEELNAYLSQLTHRAPVVIFIKGSPDVPRCGFSKQLINLLNGAEIEYDYFDILGDEQVRQGLKKFSDWPTYPQLYIGGELQGGLDIVKELHANGELKELVAASAQ